MKLKTSKSAAKRIIKVTKNGKFVRRGMSAQHRAKGKSKRTKRLSGLNTLVTKASLKTMKKLIPYR